MMCSQTSRATSPGLPKPLLAGWILVGMSALAWPAWAASGDLEPNGTVDLRDFIQIRNRLGQTGAPGFVPADLNADGSVNFQDVLIWRLNFPSLVPLAPYLSIFHPTDGSAIGERRPEIVIDYGPGPNLLPVNVNSLQITLDGQNRTAEAIIKPTSALLIPSVSLADGQHVLTVSIADNTGAASTATSHFEVVSYKLVPEALPTMGPAPLSVNFFPGVVFADTPPAFYSWDFNNDGTYEIVDARPDERTFTFTDEGVHTVRFQVTKSDNTNLSTTLKVYVTETVASASPSNGKAPLTVFLHGIAVDPNDPITKYEWDFDYNGTFGADYTSTTNPNTPHVYPLPGIYKPVFRATYQSGTIKLFPVYQGEVYVNAGGAPIATASAAQTSEALTVAFAGAGTDDGSITKYEWDFENDGVWDFSSPTTGLVTHTYLAAGSKIAALRVTDNDGKTSTDRVRFDVIAPANLEVLDDTVASATGEQTTIRTTLTIKSTVYLYIRTKEGMLVRTLVDHVERAPGIYNDIWDGKDDHGQAVHPGAYYAILQYAYPGRTDVLDLAQKTGEVHYFAPRLPPDPDTFDALANNPLPMTFRISKASRASLYILPGGSNRTETLFDNIALGAGDYTFYWEGLDDKGQFAPDNLYLWSVNGWTLPDNVVVATGRPTITNLLMTPQRLSPTDRPLGSAVAQVAFDLDVPASILLDIYNMDTNKIVRSFRLDNQPAGHQIITWDGKSKDGIYVSPAFYRLSIRAVDNRANLSFERTGLMEIRY